MATELSEGEEEGKVTGGNQVLIVEDDLREMGKKATKSMASLPSVMRTSRPIGSFFFFFFSVWSQIRWCTTSFG